MFRPSHSDSDGPLAVAVIGHVNHGKTALVRALTGIETDRLKEEIERGLSITLGFAWRDDRCGGIDLIDTPGHEDFVRAMVAGATGACAVLLVISAVEGVRLQTWEHLRIAGLLGIRHGVVAVTKADLLAPGDAAAIRADLELALAETFMAGEPIVLCSTVSGDGLDDLHACLEALHDRRSPAETLAGAFLAIDRAFNVTGVGAVVTGTLRGAPLVTGAQGILEPSGCSVGLRRLQVHGREVEVAEPGGRVAVSLRGVTAAEVRAGEVLCAPGAFRATDQVDVLLSVSEQSGRPLKHLDQLRVLWGTRQDIASLRLLGERSAPPGGQSLAQLRFAAPVVAYAGQRAVLRRLSPAETVGGVVVLDPVAAPLKGKPAGRVAVLEAALSGDRARIADALARGTGGVVSVADLGRLARRSVDDVRQALDDTVEWLDADRFVSRAAADRTRNLYLEQVAEAHGREPVRLWVPVGAIRDRLAPAASRELIAQAERGLAAQGAIRLHGAGVALFDHDPLAGLSASALERLSQIETGLRGGGLMPPDVKQIPGASDLDAELVDLLVDRGRAAALRNHALRQTLVFHVDALASALEALKSVYPPPARFTTGEARVALATTRKFIVPVLEHFDAGGLTLREGDLRQVAPD